MFRLIEVKHSCSKRRTDCSPKVPGVSLQQCPVVRVEVSIFCDIFDIDVGFD